MHTRECAERSEERVIGRPGLDAPVQPILCSLQLGMSWFAERPGGLDRYFYELIRNLPGVGVDVRGLVAGSPRVAADSKGSVVSFGEHDANMVSRWAGVRRAAATQLARHRFDLVASHHSLYTFPVLSLIRRLPFVVHFHGPFAAEGSAENSKFIMNWLKHKMERSVYSRADLCITLSNAFAKILEKSYRIPNKQIRVVPGGVDTARFGVQETQRESRERLNWPLDRPIVFCIRRLFKRMGLENLIAAISRVKEKVPDVLVLIAGKGWLADELQQQIESSGLHHHVRLLGFISEVDLPHAYRASDISVIPTVSLEGFGLTTVESLAAGTPPLVTPVGGLPEVVGGLSDDLIMQGTDPQSIAESIIASLLKDLKQPTSDQCREYARSRFDWSTVTLQVRSIYEEVIEAHRSRAC